MKSGMITLEDAKKDQNKFRSDMSEIKKWNPKKIQISKEVK